MATVSSSSKAQSRSFGFLSRTRSSAGNDSFPLNPTDKPTPTVLQSAVKLTRDFLPKFKKTSTRSKGAENLAPNPPSTVKRSSSFMCRSSTDCPAQSIADPFRSLGISPPGLASSQARDPYTDPWSPQRSEFTEEPLSPSAHFAAFPRDSESIDLASPPTSPRTRARFSSLSSLSSSIKFTSKWRRGPIPQHSDKTATQIASSETKGEPSTPKLMKPTLPWTTSSRRTRVNSMPARKSTDVCVDFPTPHYLDARSRTQSNASVRFAPTHHQNTQKFSTLPYRPNPSMRKNLLPAGEPRKPVVAPLHSTWNGGLNPRSTHISAPKLQGGLGGDMRSTDRRIPEEKDKMTGTRTIVDPAYWLVSPLTPPHSSVKTGYKSSPLSSPSNSANSCSSNSGLSTPMHSSPSKSVSSRGDRITIASVDSSRPPTPFFPSGPEKLRRSPGRSRPTFESENTDIDWNEIFDAAGDQNITITISPRRPPRHPLSGMSLYRL
ncbi:hypothetical protein BOTBODRAFT_211849 [Botryobasidium botryosum FD-172 SS1]|uniref:Uncharacterized protein n=1 Tax=Botryobasidium botryosum (strain FD-172 SS1) TaxID=930990 RepID=A0A067N1I5_BOTB1|nr:hypothetical protein BOTBODRAFT_211849 [Botryobasidium botryosum FD-172 SS1]